jgi:hypothetical protein
MTVTKVCCGYSENCRCERCLALAQKCSRGGCPNRRHADGEFCLSCLTSGRSKMRPGSACDNLVALPEPPHLATPAR